MIRLKWLWKTYMRENNCSSMEFLWDLWYVRQIFKRPRITVHERESSMWMEYWETDRITRWQFIMGIEEKFGSDRWIRSVTRLTQMLFEMGDQLLYSDYYYRGKIFLFRVPETEIGLEVILKAWEHSYKDLEPTAWVLFASSL